MATLESSSDAELISRVRGGDLEAYGALFERHREAANRLARTLEPGPDADDLVSEAFAKVLSVLRGGGGPDVAFRAYLLTALRRCHIDRARALTRTTPTDDDTVLDTGEEFTDPAVAGFESAAAARAYRSLPERWQMVLWHLDVEGQKPAEIAPLLGMSANSVSALAYRAREGLRQAFLQMHAADVVDEECARTRELLGGYVRQGLSRRDNERVSRHLEHCRRCTALYLELIDVNSSMAAVLGPLVLGGSAAAYLAAGSGTTAGAAGIGLLLGRVRDLVASNTQTTVLVGAAAGLAGVAAAGFFVINAHHGSPTTEAAPPHSSTAPTGPAPSRHHATHRTHPASPAPHLGTSPTASQTSTPSPTPATAERHAHHTPVNPVNPTTPSTSTPPPSTPAPTPSPSPQPTPSPSAQPEAPLTVSAVVQPDHTSPLGLLSHVRVTVHGLPPGKATTVSIHLAGPVRSWHAPGGCDTRGLVSVCTVTGKQPSLVGSILSLHLVSVIVHLL